MNSHLRVSLLANLCDRLLLAACDSRPTASGALGTPAAADSTGGYNHNWVLNQASGRPLEAGPNQSGGQCYPQLRSWWAKASSLGQRLA